MTVRKFSATFVLKRNSKQKLMLIRNPIAKKFAYELNNIEFLFVR